MKLILPAAMLLCVTTNLLAQRPAHEPSPAAREKGHPIYEAAVLDSIRQALSAAPSTGNGIVYHGGPVMTAPIHVYYIWYGNWNGNDAVALLESFASNIGGSAYFAVNTTYSDSSGASVPNSVQFGGSIIDNYSLGKSLGDGQIWQIVSNAISGGKFPADANGVYFVLTSKDVRETSGFCSYYCGWHTANSMGGTTIKYSFVGDSGQCPQGCSAQQTSPNGNVGADGMASVIAHELSETVSDPNLNAWYDSRGGENGDKCAWTFGVTQAASNGSRYNLTLGKYNYLIQQMWVNAGGGSCVMQYVVPTLSAVSPASGGVGTSVPITITGGNFGTGANLTISGSGVTASNVVVVNPTQITATLQIAAGTAPGPYAISVTMGVAASSSVTFTVSTAALTLASVSPATALQGAAVPVTLTGANFGSGAAVQVSGAGVAVNNVKVVSTTQITATLSVDKAAAVGSRTIAVGLIGKTSNTVGFTVGSSAVTIGSLTPSSGAPGKTISVTIAGTNFSTGSTVQVSGTGVTVGGVAVVSATQITAQLTVASTAAAGSRNLTVTAGGVSNAAAFAVNPAATLSLLSVTSAPAGSTVSVTLTGANFAPGSTVAISGAGVTASNISVASATQIIGQIVIDKTAAVGARSVTVVNGGVSTGAVPFTVLTAAPSVTSLSVTSSAPGTTVPVTISGSNFASGATVSVSGGGVTVGTLTGVSGSQITAQFIIDKAAVAGSRNVTVAVGGAASNAVVFNVTSSAPTLGGLSVASGIPGSTVPITLTGTNFGAAATLAVSGVGVTASGITVVNSTQINAQLAIATGAAAGPRNLTVAVGSAVSNVVPFTVTPAAPYRVTGMNPGGMGQGITGSIAITGSGFPSNSTIGVSGGGVTVTQLQVSPSLITATFAVDSGASVGSRSITVNSGNTISAPVPFVINPAGPVVSQVSPATGKVGSTVTMTLTGSGFTTDSYIVTNGTGITVGKTTYVSPTQMTVNLTMGGATGTRFLLVVVPSARYVITSTPVYFTLTN